MRLLLCGKLQLVKPHVKKWTAATLVALCLLIIAQVIGIIIMFNVVRDKCQALE